MLALLGLGPDPSAVTHYVMQARAAAQSTRPLFHLSGTCPIVCYCHRCS